GVGGIEAEAGMLGQPVYFLTPDVVGVELKNKLHPACTATDLVLTVTEMLRKAKVVGKFVEYFGEGTRSLSVTDRATVANMAPEYGATMGFFPVDDKTIAYFRGTGRTDAEIDAFQAYFKAQGLYGIPKAGAIDYSQSLELDLSTVMPSLAGPKRPQDRIDLEKVKSSFSALFSKPEAESGYNKPAAELARRHESRFGGAGLASGGGRTWLGSQKSGAPAAVVEMVDNRPTPGQVESARSADAGRITIGHGDVLIAAITSCTNTSNPGVLLAAGLLAKKAVELGLRVKPHIKTSLAPGSRVVTEYLTKAGLLPYLEQVGFYLAGYGCTTCIGNAGPLDPGIEETVVKQDLVCCAVLSGNRNFEARIHANIKANFLASPPLVVAYAIAGTVLKDFKNEPLGKSKDGQDVYIGHIWP
ncbi:MAG: aconitase family protein, partial [Pseudomonadota bacterium]